MFFLKSFNSRPESRCSGHGHGLVILQSRRAGREPTNDDLLIGENFQDLPSWQEIGTSTVSNWRQREATLLISRHHG